MVARGRLAYHHHHGHIALGRNRPGAWQRRHMALLHLRIPLLLAPGLDDILGRAHYQRVSRAPGDIRHAESRKRHAAGQSERRRHSHGGIRSIATHTARADAATT